MKSFRTITVVASIAFISGCGDKPEDHIAEAFEKYIKRNFLMPPQVKIHESSCDSGFDLASGGRGYNCTVKFTSTDISGIAHTQELTPTLVKDSTGWHFSGN